MKGIDKVLQVIVDFTNMKGTGQISERVSVTDFIRVVHQKFKGSDPYLGVFEWELEYDQRKEHN